MQRRTAVHWVVEERQISERRACRIVQQTRTTQRRVLQGRTAIDEPIVHRLLELAESHPARILDTRTESWTLKLCGRILDTRILDTQFFQRDEMETVRSYDRTVWSVSSP